ncbi:MAG TPA: sigma-70 family RNA polymerase sigma factor [Povalibacter sp.]|uniref:sigma-70 family RNA polymerase sigma factor n=1 Tax=Povalibacter sp. TaxID=1962978 RepID=UPI002CE2AB1A|nr:sigma-70 family RNA polymerase sigma factor [Povalibacter sp.]HMN43777.1 sigma-70 family RNA polymerase sigma factor [Povalibacter sp.]
MSHPSATGADPLHSLYANHHGWLQNWLRRKLSCSEQAADLAQDTFVRVLRTAGDEPIREPRSYLIRIAGGLVVDYFRRRRVERAFLEYLARVPESCAPSPETREILIESLVRIDAMLDGLKPRVREVFLLSQIDGLTYPQIAQRVGISLRSVSNHMTVAFDHCFGATES